MKSKSTREFTLIISRKGSFDTLKFYKHVNTLQFRCQLIALYNYTLYFYYVKSENMNIVLKMSNFVVRKYFTYLISYTILGKVAKKKGAKSCG